MDTLPDARRRPAGNHPDPAHGDVVVVRQSRARRDGMFGILLAVFAVALGRGVSGASTTAGRIAVVVIFGLIVIVIAVAWVRAILRPAHLDISPRLIHYAGAPGGSRPDLIKDNGPEVRVYWRRAGRTSYLTIEQPASTLRWSLPYFSPRAVADACRACGWQTGPLKSPSHR
jgi:hypothetical protein